MKRNKIVRILSAFLTILVVLCVCLSLYICAKIILGGEPSLLGYRYFYLISGSMEPTIPQGSIVIVHQQKSYAVGDVITFISENEEIAGRPNTHRIIEVITEKGKTRYATQGDANKDADKELVRKDQIYGKVVFKMEKLSSLGTVFDFLTMPIGFVSIVLLPLLAIGIFSLKDGAKAYREALRQQVAERMKDTDHHQNNDHQS